MKLNDIDLANWQDCAINVDSLLLIQNRDKSGKHKTFIIAILSHRFHENLSLAILQKIKLC